MAATDGGATVAAVSIDRLPLVVAAPNGAPEPRDRTTLRVGAEPAPNGIDAPRRAASGLALCPWYRRLGVRAGRLRPMSRASGLRVVAVCRGGSEHTAERLRGPEQTG